MIQILSFMQKILLLIIVCLSFCGIFSAYAAWSVNSAWFTVDLAAMDPLTGSSPGNASIGTSKHGIEALFYIIWNITNLLLFVIPMLAGISLLVAGYFYIFSAGDSEKVGRAKTIIKWNIVALFVAFLSYGIVSIVASFFNKT